MAKIGKQKQWLGEFIPDCASHNCKHDQGRRSRGAGGGARAPPQYFKSYKELVRKNVLCPLQYGVTNVPPPPTPSQSCSAVPDDSLFMHFFETYGVRSLRLWALVLSRKRWHRNFDMSVVQNRFLLFCTPYYRKLKKHLINAVVE